MVVHLDPHKKGKGDSPKKVLLMEREEGRGVAEKKKNLVLIKLYRPLKNYSTKIT